MLTTDDCKYTAHNGSQVTWGDVCANLVGAIKNEFPKTSYKDICNDFLNTEIDNHFKLISISASKYLLQFRCNSGAYNKSFIYFLFDQDQFKLDKKALTRVVPEIIMFPADPSLLAKTELQKRWQLSDYEALVYTNEFNLRTHELTSWRKGLGDGSVGYYTKYKFDSHTGFPTLIFTSIRILDDHNVGYNFNPKKAPEGSGWVPFRAPSGIVGKLSKFQ